MANASVFDKASVEAEKVRHDWLGRLTALVESVERWGQELGWSTRRIEKPMEDSELGPYRAPALIMQQETARVLLEPIARSAPGAEGVVDLYLMPAYDDIASLYFYGAGWHLHYMNPGTPDVASTREAPSRPLSKATFAEVLDEMKKNVA